MLRWPQAPARLEGMVCEGVGYVGDGGGGVRAVRRLPHSGHLTWLEWFGTAPVRS
jgi:hypothetical protein